MVQVKLGFHITDWLSLVGFGDFAVAQHGDRRSSERLTDACLDDTQQPPCFATTRRRKAQGRRCSRFRASSGGQLELHAVHRQVLAVRQAVRVV